MVKWFKEVDWGYVLCWVLMLIVGVFGVLGTYTEVKRQANLTPQQRYEEQLAREEAYKKQREEDRRKSVFCSPCIGPHLRLDGKGIGYGISPFGISLF